MRESTLPRQHDRRQVGAVRQRQRRRSSRLCYVGDRRLSAAFRMGYARAVLLIYVHVSVSVSFLALI